MEKQEGLWETRRVAQHLEVEWQFVVRDVDAFERWVVRASFGDRWSVVPDRVLRLRDSYFDTADWCIWRARFALRVRRSGGGVEATLKALRRARAGRASRQEISVRLADARMRSLRSASGALGTRLRRIVGDVALVRLLALRTRRRTFAVRHDGRVVAELALDRTEIVTVGRRCARRLERVEVEVGAGSPELVGRFVATLRRQRHLTTAGRSKFEAGLAAAGYVRPRRR